MRDVSKTFHTHMEVKAIESLDLAVPKNTVVAIVGPSGCGKTTLLNLAAGFLKPDTGMVLVDQYPAFTMRGRSAMVFQVDSVFPWLSVKDNVSYGIPAGAVSAESHDAIVRKYIQLVGLEGFEGSWPRDLSGGMNKRVELARAYAHSPEVLLMDEPFGALDVLTKQDMQVMLWQLWRREPKTILFATHDIEEAIFMSHRVLVMSSRPGRVVDTVEIPEWQTRQPDLRLSQEFINIRGRIIRHFNASARNNYAES